MTAVYCIAYSLIAAFFLIESFVRKGPDAKTLQKTEHDRGSTNLVAFAFIASCVLLVAAPVLNDLHAGFMQMNLGFNILGLIIAAAGILIRITAVQTLGRFYTRTLRETDDHQIVSNGIYQYIRHPGYLGNILLFIGAGFALGNLYSFIVITVLFLVIYVYRIKVEEQMLVGIFGDHYKEYSKKTKKLLPFIY